MSHCMSVDMIQDRLNVKRHGTARSMSSDIAQMKLRVQDGQGTKLRGTSDY